MDAPDYQDEDFTGPGYYLVHRNLIGHIDSDTFAYHHPKPGGPYDTVTEMAIAERLDDYPSNGYVVFYDGEAVSSVPSLNPDELIQRREIPDLDETPDAKGWRREGGITTFDAGIGGDDMVGQGYEARYVRELGDGTFAVISDRYYVEDMNRNHNVEPGDEGYEPNSYGITNQTEFMHCSSLDDVGGTEITSDIEYDPVDAQPFASYDDVLTWYENECTRLAIMDQRSNLFFMDDYGSWENRTLAANLKPGDQFLRVEYNKPDITITVVRAKEPTQDRFGRDLFRFWCRREDTGQEGYMDFGPGGVVPTTIKRKAD